MLGTNRRVTARLCSLTLLVLFHISASAQQFKPATAANAKQFVGVWKASFHGSPFLTVTLALDGNKLGGKISHADIEVNNAGELTKAEADDTADPAPIIDARVNGDTLRITTKSSDGSEESIEADLKLVGPDAADMRLVVPPDVPSPKPWRLERVVTKH